MIESPIREVYEWVVYKPLEIQLHGTKKIPGVIATKTINSIHLGNIGHRRIVCLADGNTATEEHTFIEKQDDYESQRYFSYRVSNYTLKIAQNIEYALGEWWFTPIADKTSVRWRYSFKLNKQRLLGKSGFIGRALFKIIFIKASYNEFMVETLKQLKIALEKSRTGNSHIASI
jgi:hypothetical protein